MYKYFYNTPNSFPNIVMTSDGEFFAGLWFENSIDEFKHGGQFVVKQLPIFDETICWLDMYFSGKIPTFVSKYKINNLASFRKMVIDVMNKIPYGTTITYNDIVKEIACKLGIKEMSARWCGRLESNLFNYSMS